MFKGFYHNIFKYQWWKKDLCIGRVVSHQTSRPELKTITNIVTFVKRKNSFSGKIYTVVKVSCIYRDRQLLDGNLRYGECTDFSDIKYPV